jgi:hypothetical protein
MLGDQEDYGTAASQQSLMSEIRTDEGVIFHDLSERRQKQKHKYKDTKQIFPLKTTPVRDHIHTMVMKTKTQD